ncbi:integral membrane protein [Aspergillus costaricaensis CBS 115574]|uniref:Integral membrane protein n=1 Tax=Aspergillus costaricaensis CBS 115574 TaxID=1448317 RepID=A0ACD1INH1_9EURO|nr:integral membrane protein [Aspergillus costaricaensis CBS 115574]RAK91661.1 integral membrane protein [Aspergillus costaricaensis CBS 115574]
MVSLKFRRSDESDRTGQQRDREDERRHDEPDERTRLLPREPPAYLSPDDPAVSPYNLWGIRALRGLSSLFLAISFIWWTFLLVSLFVSPPMMHSRGSGFFSFAYTTLTTGYLLLGLLFFAIPSKPMSVSGIIIAIFLLIDMILTLAVPRIRLEEGWVGVASVVWAAFISLYTIVQNHSVAWGKREEEERLTGRPETRRPLREWVAVLIQTVFLVIFAIIVILFTATLILRARDASLPAPGKKYYVNGDSYQVHLHCVGNATHSLQNDTPTILIEGGDWPVEHTLQPFIHDAYQSGLVPRYCYWDRPGFGWSDNAPSPFSAGMAADALSEALALAGEEGPWILVSASVGGIYSRIFASRHLLEISGIVLIDSLHEDYLSNIGSPGRGFTLWLRGIFTPLGLDRIAGAIFKGRTREDRVYGRSSYQTGKIVKAKLQENLVAESMTSSEIQTARHVQMADTPLVVISSGIEVRKSEKWAKRQEELTKITKNLKNFDIVKGAPHEVWRDVEGRRVIEKRLGELVKKDE